jgi:hypothetical protein
VLDQHAVPELKQIQNADVDLATAGCQIAECRALYLARRSDALIDSRWLSKGRARAVEEYRGSMTARQRRSALGCLWSICVAIRSVR